MGFWRRLRGKGGYESGASVDARRASMSQQFGGLDELGFPVSGKNPPGEIADQVQLQSESIVAKRNARLNQEALGALQGGLGTLQSYRPGGAAALASPYYSQMAQVLQGSQTQAPDLLHNSRVDAEMKARKASREAANMQIAGAVIQAAGVALAPMTGGASLVAATGLNGVIQSGLAAQRTPSGAGQAANSAHGWGGMGTPGAPQGTPQGGQQAPQGQPQQQVPGAEAYGAGGPQTTSQPTTQPQGGAASRPSSGSQPTTQKLTQGGPVSQGGEGGQTQGGPNGAGMNQVGSGMADPGASAFGPATPMGSAYPSREGAIAAGTARFGAATYDLVSQVYVQEFGDDNFYEAVNSAIDAQFARITSLV